MPFVLVELAATERVKRRACLYGNVGNDEARVVSWKMCMNALRKDAEFIVKEDDDHDNDSRKSSQLKAGADLEKQAIIVSKWNQVSRVQARGRKTVLTILLVMLAAWELCAPVDGRKVAAGKR